MSTSREPKNPAAEFISVNDKLIDGLIDMRAKVDEMRKVIGKTERDVFYDSLNKMIEAAEKLKKEFPNGLADVVKQSTENGPYEINTDRFAIYLSLYLPIYNMALVIGGNPQNEATLNNDIAAAKKSNAALSYDNTLTQNLLKPVRNFALFKNMLADIKNMKGQSDDSKQGFDQAAEVVNAVLASQQTKKSVTLTHNGINDILNNIEDQIKKLPKSSSSKEFYTKQISEIRRSLSEYNYEKIGFQLTEIYIRADESLEKRKGVGFYRKGTTSLHQNIRDLSYGLSQGLTENKNNQAALEAAKPQLFLQEAKKLQDAAVGADQQLINKKRNAASNPDSQATLQKAANDAKQKYNNFLDSSPLTYELREALRENKQGKVEQIVKKYWPMFVKSDYIKSFMANVDKDLTDAQRFNLTRALMAVAEEPTITTPDNTDTESLANSSEITDTSEFDIPEESSEEELEEEWDLGALNTALKDAAKKMESEDLQAFLQGEGETPEETDELDIDDIEFADKLTAAMKNQAGNQNDIHGIERPNPFPDQKSQEAGKPKGRELKDAIHQDIHGIQRPNPFPDSKSREAMAARYKKIAERKAATDPPAIKTAKNDATFSNKGDEPEVKQDEPIRLRK